MIRMLSETPDVTNVLIVEDDADDAFLIERALIRVSSIIGGGVNVTRYNNGWDAVRAVGRSDVVDELPDFVVADLNMPVMDGMRFVRLLRTEFRLPDLPTFVLTTSDRPEIHQAARLMGADLVFRKPETHTEYVEIAQAMLDAARKMKAAAAERRADPQRAIG